MADTSRRGYVERRDKRVIGQRAKSGGWDEDRNGWRYRPGGLFTRGFVSHRKDGWRADVSCGWSLSGFATRRAAMRATERLWGFWIDLNSAPPTPEKP